MKKPTKETVASILEGQDWKDINNAIYRAMTAIDKYYKTLEEEGKEPGSRSELNLCDRLEVIYNEKIPKILDVFFPDGPQH